MDWRWEVVVSVVNGSPKPSMPGICVVAVVGSVEEMVVERRTSTSV